MAGYSSTPLAKKLGIKEGFKIKVINGPPYYLTLFTDLPENISFDNEGKHKKDLIHFFTKDADELSEQIPRLKKEIPPNGIIWVSWPKKTSKVPTDVNEHLIRDIAIKAGLVDIKVCAVDNIWSGLKLVIPVMYRHKI